MRRLPLLFSSCLIASLAASAAQDVQPLVLVGDTLPSGSHVVEIGRVTVDQHGSWLVEVETDDPSAPRAFLREGGVYAQVGDPVSFPGGASIRSIDSISLDVLGIATWILGLEGTAGGAADARGLFCDLGIVLQSGKPAYTSGGVFPTGATWASFAEVQSSSNNPVFLLRGAIDDPATPGVPLGFLATGSYAGSICALGSPDVLTFDGQTAPGLTRTIEALRMGPSAARFAEGWLGPDVVLWSCDLNGPTSSDGCVYLSELWPVTHTLLAREGDPSPVPGRSWGPLETPSVDVADFALDWTLRAELDGSDPTSDEIIVKSGAVLVQEGDTHPDVAPFTFDGFGQGRASLDRNGRALWYGHWNAPAGAVEPEALFLDRIALIRPGDTTVGGVGLLDLESGEEDYSLGPYGHATIFKGVLADGARGAFLLELGEVELTCASKKNSLGCQPRTTWSGPWPSASAGSGFSLRVDQVLSQVNGLLFYGTNGGMVVPFAGGLLCVAPPIVRLPVRSTGGSGPPGSACDGVLSEDFNAFIATGTDPNLVAGTEVHAQYWYRDPGFSVPDDVGLSHSLSLVIEP